MKTEMRLGDYVLISLRDPGLPTRTYFWVKESKSKDGEMVSERIVSPYFGSEQEACIWADNNPKWHA